MKHFPNSPNYFRARLDVFRDLIAQTANTDPDISLLRNGVMREKAREEILIQARFQTQDYPNTPLSLLEMCSFNNWFAMHPEKVCGKEVITSSREFPLTIKGDKTSIENSILHAIDENRQLPPASKTFELETLALELENQFKTT